MKTFRATTSFITLAFSLSPAAALAQLSISTATTTPVKTSTATSGTSAGDITVTSAGSITLDGGSAITVDSNNAVSNAGTITVGAANGSTAIDVNGGTSGAITNTGTIAVKETFTSPNADGNSIVDGAIAQATDRAGIRVRGAHTGDITQGGAIGVEGLNSAGIRIDGTETGSIRTSAATAVRGDYSVGLQTGAVTGNIVAGGSISVVGRGATAINVTGDVGGYIRIANSVGQQLSFTDDNSTTMSLSRADLRVNAPAVAIAGNVGGGIIVAAAPTTSTSNSDTDGDGVADSSESTGVITSYGNGAALLVGSATNNITISAVSGDTHGIVIAGSVLSNANYSNTDTIAMQIGGLGGNVTVAGGISVTGTVQATTNDAMATAILINAGSSVPVIDNTGTILASISSPGEGATYGIRDLSGTLTTINTNGYISATGTSEDTTDAIDLRANTSGVTITQTANASSSITSTILGNILTGSGNDTINATAGAIKGSAFLGDGNDTINLSGATAWTGNADFGTGTATLTLADTSTFTGTTIFNDQAATITIGGTAIYKGQITGGSNLAVTVNGGTLEASGTNDLVFKSLTVNSGGTLQVAINTTDHTNPKFVVNTATFASGSHIAASIDSLSNAEGSYVVLTAGQLTGTPTFDSTTTALPFLFKGAVTVDQTAGQITLDISRKTATELNFNRSQAAIYNAVLAAAPSDTSIQDSLLGATDEATVKADFNQLMPDHAGGNFDLLTRGSRQATRHLTNNNSMFDISDVGGWLEVLKWHGSKDEGQSAGYTAGGFGISGGLERKTGIGNVGVTLAWMSGKNENSANANAIDVNDYEIGAFWRVSKGPLYAFARAAISFANFSSSRTYSGTDSADTAFTRTATADWKGKMYSGTFGISYQLDAGERLSFKPMAIVDYYRLTEKGYSEANGGDAMNLTVAGRTSDATTATTTLTGIYRFGPRSKDGIPLTIELEGGRRNVIGSTLGDTVAHFTDGSDFRLTADKLKGAWLGEVRLLSGGLDYTWTLAGGAEQTQGNLGYSARISLGVAF